MANEPTSSDEIPLTDIVQSTATPASAAPPPPADSPKGEGEDVAAIDALLATEDPQFAASMTELRQQVAQDAGNVELDSLDLEEKPPGKIARLKALILRPINTISGLADAAANRATKLKTSSVEIAKDGGKVVVEKSKHGLAATGGAVKGTLGSFKALPLKSKLLVFAVIVMGVLSIMTLKIVLKGPVLPTLETKYLGSFAEVADKSYEYDNEEPMEDFTDPFFHPEHVMLIDKIVVNLRRDEEGSNPMGLFEFYIEASSDEGAIEIKDREVEVRDVISRTLEQMPYDELVTAAGKNKVKVILRKNLNQFLTKGRVRRVYFRNVVLKA